MKTILYDEHCKLGARMIEFNGWEMPVQYTSVIDEHLATRSKVTIFDTSHMGEFMVQGKDAIPYLQHVIGRDITKLKEHKCFYTVMCNKNGGVVDDLIVYKFNDEKYMLVINAGTIEDDLNHLVSNKGNFNVKIENISPHNAKLDIQGPLSEEVLAELFNFDLKEIPRFGFKTTLLCNNDAILSRTGYTGEKGFEIYLDKGCAVEMWKRIMEVGEKHGIKPAGLGARDTLRLECCYSLYGHELSPEITPLEAGIPFTINMDKDFIGKQAINEPKRTIVAFELKERGVPREHYKVLKDNKEIGYVTSGTMSPTFKKGIGLALVDIDYSKVGIEIDINIREKLFKAKIVERPFYKYGGVK